VKDQIIVASGAAKPSFADEPGVSSWAKEAIAALTEAGIIKGYEDGSIRPKEKITRAEIASIVANFVK
ncbi:S-layer homology domain-containing protein, partial [Paenibacillus sp. TAF43_2]